jgi:IPT/TIG domain
VVPSSSLILSLELSTDSGTSWSSIATGLSNTGTFDWTVPSDATTHGRVRVTASNGQLQASISSGSDFTISLPGPPADPILTALVPTRTVVADTVLVQGTGFGASQGASQVLFSQAGGGTVSAVPAGAWTDTEIPVLVPAGAASGSVTVTVGGVQSPALDFQVAGALISFTSDLSQNILKNAGCNACHAVSPYNPNFPNNPGLDVNSYQKIMLGTSQHVPVVRRRHSRQSLLWLKVSQVTPPVGERMPQGGPYLNDAAILKIADWIDQGARDN